MRITPASGERIERRGDALHVPSHPIIPFIEGDGIGPDVWRASRRVLDAAVERAYGDERRVEWMETLAGEKAFATSGQWLPKDTLDRLRDYVVGIKGPLATPVGGGIRSLNVTLRMELDLYACIRPVRYFRGVGTPVTHPERLNVVIFRENTEDVYAGIEWKAGSAEAARVRDFLVREMKSEIRERSAIGIKPVSEFGSKRLIAMAISYALRHGHESVTLVHKGNIMKYTEGGFREWGYELAREQFGDVVCSEADLAKGGAASRVDALVLKDRIADAMFQELLLRPEQYAVLATTNLNGDYLSDAAAAQVGGLGIAPGGNVGDGYAVFEATHGTAPKYADKDVINPGSVILSGVMMFDLLGWHEAARLIEDSMEATIQQKKVTYDFERQMEGATKVKTSEFAEYIVKNMDGRTRSSAAD
jgi:isocitrate dehydrogenase